MIREEEKRVYDVLKELNIDYIRYEHPAIFTIEEANNLNIHMEGQHCKNLFIRNRKGDIHYLLIITEWKQVNLKDLSKEIESSSLSFASEERLYKYLSLTPGSVTPFGLINDKEKSVKVLIDKDLINCNKISFHPNVNTATITISYDDFEKFLHHQGNEFNYIKI
ncbi:prolyl-tRNA synthetase associated domain-containing protein [Clostridium malenominatum]|uniref:Prolyl-tRNA synthetase associated domain-containing protein n=1 Tax=Clostridium malenominatum TaxID=1539 RepID=A0ABP3UGH3_9CLOT